MFPISSSQLISCPAPAVYSELHPARVWPRHASTRSSEPLLFWDWLCSSCHNLPDFKDVALSSVHLYLLVICSAPLVPQLVFTITEKAARAFSWLKVTTSAFTFKTLLRHYAKRALTPRSLNVKLCPRRNFHKGRVAIRHYANQTSHPL